MFAFFRTWITRNGTATYQDADQVIDDTLAQLRRLRQAMALAYEELELGMRMADHYAQRLDDARSRAQAVVSKQPVPEKFTLEHRQRSQVT